MLFFATLVSFLLLLVSLVICLPDYVHLHTQLELNETNIVLLDKSQLCSNNEHKLKKSNQSKQPKLVIAIKTWPGNKKQRDVLRRSWGKEAKELSVPIVFMMGSTFDKKVVKELIVEDEEHQDMVIGKPVDNYYNLTLKAIFVLSWTRTYCSDRWLLYVDDDTIVNVKKVLEFVHHNNNINSTNNSTELRMYCHALRGYPVVRQVNSKWFLSRQVWPEATYPDYCLGIGYLIPPNVLRPLHETALSPLVEPKLWIDDVFIGGIVSKAANVKLIESNFKCCGNGGLELFDTSLVLGEMGKGEELYRRWVEIRGKEQSYTSDRSHTSSGAANPAYVIETFDSTVQVVRGTDKLRMARSESSSVTSTLMVSPIFLVLLTLIVLTLLVVKRVSNIRQSKCVYRNL